ncbi:MAG: hypothetical protein OWU32_04275 [Firmicutes bacterium]|nr:hypothetical protein [Bacillota bacterium]
MAISPSGGIFVSNFSNKAGTNGAGTTIEQIVSGKPVTFFSGANGPAAMVFSPKGPLWIANFGQQGSDGNVQVISAAGQPFSGGTIMTGPAVQGPWGQVFAPGFTYSTGGQSQTVPAAFFVTGAQNGTVAAMYGFNSSSFATTTKFDVIGSHLAWSGTNANNIQGPQGMVWDATSDTLYVTDTADNSIRAFSWTGPNTMNQGIGKLVYQGGDLNAPVGLAQNPINGDLIVANQGNNDIVELALPTGPAAMASPVAEESVDSGPAGALFGLAATTDATGHLVVYFTDDNTNTLDELSYSAPMVGSLPEVPYAGALPLLGLAGFAAWTAARRRTRKGH